MKANIAPNIWLTAARQKSIKIMSADLYLDSVLNSTAKTGLHREHLLHIFKKNVITWLNV